jgi:hypothetical protein
VQDLRGSFLCPSTSAPNSRALTRCLRVSLLSAPPTVRPLAPAPLPHRAPTSVHARTPLCHRVLGPPRSVSPMARPRLRAQTLSGRFGIHLWWDRYTTCGTAGHRPSPALPSGGRCVHRASAPLLSADAPRCQCESRAVLCSPSRVLGPSFRRVDAKRLARLRH